VTGAVSVAVEGAGVAAWACRENTSKTAKTPKAKIATRTARRAMCRKIGSDTVAPVPSGDAADPNQLPAKSGSKRPHAIFCDSLRRTLARFGGQASSHRVTKAGQRA
jgi:hypothetical protein